MCIERINIPGRRMKILNHIVSAASLALGLLLSVGPLASPAHAGYIVTLAEVGSDVVAVGSGSIDLTGLSLIDNSPGNIAATGIIPPLALIATGPRPQARMDTYLALTPSGPSSFGVFTGVVAADTGGGDFVWFRGPNLFGLPHGYVSNDPLLSDAEWLNQSLAGLGAQVGTYVWTWGDGANQNFTLKIGDGTNPEPPEPPSVIPEPPSLTLLGMGLGALLLACAIRRVRPAG
jgi:hypothetical protein